MKKQRAHHAKKLHSGHFAFMRAVVQGLDARAAWDLTPLLGRLATESIDFR